MTIKTLTVCGSLRSGSSNANFLEAYTKCAPSNFEFSSLDTIGTLPIYSPDLDCDPLPTAVSETRQKVSQAELLLFSTPEYIHSLPAALKNLLEWLVSDPEFQGKKAVILHAKSSSKYALAELKEILRTMSARILDDACVVADLDSNKVSVDQILGDEELRNSFTQSSYTILQKYNESIQS